MAVFQYPGSPAGNPLVRLLLFSKIHSCFTGIVVIQRPAAILILLFTDEVNSVFKAGIFSIVQPDEGFDILQQVGDVENRETKFPPVTAWFLCPAGGIS